MMGRSSRCLFWFSFREESSCIFFLNEESSCIQPKLPAYDGSAHVLQVHATQQSSSQPQASHNFQFKSHGFRAAVPLPRCPSCCHGGDCSGQAFTVPRQPTRHVYAWWRGWCGRQRPPRRLQGLRHRCCKFKPGYRPRLWCFWLVHPPYTIRFLQFTVNLRVRFDWVIFLPFFIDFSGFEAPLFRYINESIAY